MEQDADRLNPADIAALARRLGQEPIRPIVLVGMMGVGKSSVGRRLAHALSLPFVDADDAIEEAAQMSIPEIFDTYGETYFRDGERRVIQRLIADSAAGKPMIIATGGGAFVNPETRALILDKGIAVWLDSDVDTLMERVGRKDNRPLLRGGNPREILARLRAEREPAYSQAPIKVMSGNQPHGRTLAKVMKGIAQWL
jgi:shikimate kinase